LFPKDLPKNTRFAINFFTSIGLGGLTYEHLLTRTRSRPLSPPPTPTHDACCALSVCLFFSQLTSAVWFVLALFRA
jgi:hypothetical protein